MKLNFKHYLSKKTITHPDFMAYHPIYIDGKIIEKPVRELGGKIEVISGELSILKVVNE